MNLKSVMLVALLLAVLFAGCIGDENEVAPMPVPAVTPEPTPAMTPTPEPMLTPEPTPVETITLRSPKPIYLDKYAIAPKNPTIRAGEALNWINLQKSSFVLVSGEGLWENHTISYGKKFKYTFNTSGNYTYHCPGYGSSMCGTVTVLP